ncbi:hypothetical protein EC973_000143 [Apophysomyces ossiformis]|uniref:Uncharacterized protein n=1 Tax=Apophysomyces ossiformis TaxID=679940 RepID=A0A8H7BYE7_9FUNG|nr:hypothetical protein EC973_000143 [Apophysomyces ossiformis]
MLLYTQQYAMVVQNIYNAGHFIGMAYRVKNDDSSALTEDEIRKDIIAHARMIETLIKVSPKYVRLHYTKNEDTRTENILKDLGFQIVGYNLDSKDYQFRDPTGEASVEHVYRSTFRNQKETYDAKGSFISIQYDIPDTGSLAAVPYIINAINEEGYTMVRLDGCLNDPQPYKKSADSTSYVSDRFSYNTTGYHQGQKAVPLDELKTQADEQGKSASPNASSVIPKWLYLLLVPWITVITI